jgi:hypothetical protein
VVEQILEALEICRKIPKVREDLHPVRKKLIKFAILKKTGKKVQG